MTIDDFKWPEQLQNISPELKEMILYNYFREEKEIDLNDIFPSKEYNGEISDPKIVKDISGRIIGILDNPDILKYKFE